MSYKPPLKNYFYDEFFVKLKIGQHWEKETLERILLYLDGKYNLINTNDDYKYDFLLSNMIKYEVKFDAKALLTNNIFVEYLQFNVKSGIQITEADYYIIIVPKQVYLYLLINVSDIRELIRTNEYKFTVKPKQNNNYTAG